MRLVKKPQHFLNRNIEIANRQPREKRRWKRRGGGGALASTLAQSAAREPLGQGRWRATSAPSTSTSSSRTWSGQDSLVRKKITGALKNFGDMLWDRQYMRPTVFLRNYRNSFVFTLEYWSTLFVDLKSISIISAISYKKKNVAKIDTHKNAGLQADQHFKNPLMSKKGKGG